LPRKSFAVGYVNGTSVPFAPGCPFPATIVARRNSTPVDPLATTAMLDAPAAEPVAGAVAGALNASISMSAKSALVRALSVSGTLTVEGASLGIGPV
jgi:hypothetical protein